MAFLSGFTNHNICSKSRLGQLILSGTHNFLSSTEVHLPTDSDFDSLL